MIVTRQDGALSLVEQVEHGRATGELARHWGNTCFSVPTPHSSVCTAATQHDEGWRAWDQQVLFNELERRPQHFLEIDPAEHVRLYRHGVETVSLGDVYAGVLVGMHWTGLYRGFWDLLSLYLCVMPQAPDDDGESPSSSGPSPWGPQVSELEHRPQQVVLPQIRHHPFGSFVHITVSVTSPGTLTVDPYPFGASGFDASGFEVAIEHRVIPDRQYAHPEVTGTVRRAPAEQIRWRIQPREQP